MIIQGKTYQGGKGRTICLSRNNKYVRTDQSMENTRHLDVSRARARSYYRVYLEEKKLRKTNQFTAPRQT
jgi:hypothetical protein